jgi:hypothetical protein
MSWVIWLETDAVFFTAPAKVNRNHPWTKVANSRHLQVDIVAALFQSFE